MAPPGSLPTRPLGKNGPQVPRIGLGLMNNSGAYNLAPPDEQRMAFLTTAWEMGETFWDTSDLYQDSEDLLGRWFAANPDKRADIFLATKFGIQMTKEGKSTQDSSPEYCRKSIEKSLRRLGLPYVDLYYIHRVDGVTPIEETMAVLVQLKNEGKIRHIGISECAPGTLRRAHAIHPIAATQIEYSPFALDAESPSIDIVRTARELGIALVLSSPLGRGILGGAIRSQADLPKEGDFRAMLGLDWFQEETIQKNLPLVDRLTEMGKVRGATTAQITLAWILAQGDDFFPIPGTTKIERLKENLASLDVEVSKEDDQAIRKLSEEVTGARIPERWASHNYKDTPPAKSA